ncbi:hypothetical protein YC2023_095110 [Brassica napus]
MSISYPEDRQACKKTAANSTLHTHTSKPQTKPEEPQPLVDRARATEPSAGKLSSNQVNPKLRLSRRPHGKEEPVGQGQCLRTRKLTGLQTGTSKTIKTQPEEESMSHGSTRLVSHSRNTTRRTRPSLRHTREEEPHCTYCTLSCAKPNVETPRAPENHAPPCHFTGKTDDMKNDGKEQIRGEGTTIRSHALQFHGFHRRSTKRDRTKTLPKNKLLPPTVTTPSSQSHQRDEAATRFGLGSSAGERSCSRDDHISEVGKRGESRHK